jgi:uncharacterized protein
MTEPVANLIPAEPATRPGTSRRTFLRRLAKCGAALAVPVVFDTFFLEPHWVEFVERDLPIRHLPQEWVGKRLVQLSDIHVGHSVSDDYLIESFRRVAELQADVVIATGDFVTCRHGQVPVEQAQQVFRHFPRGTTATLGVLGNHDYGLNSDDHVAARTVTDILTDSGLTVLRNQSINLQGLTVVGFDDLLGRKLDAPAAFAGTSGETARLVLCHNPDAADRAYWHDYEGWILVGHTHGGQCKPPLLAPPLLPVRNRRYTAGEIVLDNNRRMYINRGLGHLLPVRFNCRPEVTIFRLVGA